MNRLEIDSQHSGEVALPNSGIMMRKPTFHGPRHFMILPNCYPQLTRSGTGVSGFTAIFSESRTEDAILGKVFQSSTSRKIHGSSEFVDAVGGQYGREDNFYVITSEIKAEGFQGLIERTHPQCKFKRINKAPQNFEKLNDE